jgi:hypothetical protein
MTKTNQIKFSKQFLVQITLTKFTKMLHKIHGMKYTDRQISPPSSVQLTFCAKMTLKHQKLSSTSETTCTGTI